ncbi:Multidrug resistance-associated protein 4-like [Oopsacas minuta]|uniref:Multidrug resistance-associated protein 4-like n=1 Tax=Oopsacas minuta TaxID=111878 RepID=A0AAV7KAY9_9METZ|nr:Multidrug resistance-associated protein 4-like [Oopsacas minuta]
MNFSPTKIDYRGRFFFQIFFLWLEPIFFKGFRKKLTQQDLYPCPEEHISKILFDKFDIHWQTELSKPNPDIKVALAKTLKTPFLIGGIFHFIEAFLLLVQAILVTELSSNCLTSYSNKSATNNVSIYSDSHGLSLSLAVLISVISLYLTVHHSIAFDILYCVGMQMRTICITAIYRKVLCLQQSVLGNTSIGHIINLASNDVYKFDLGVLFWNFYWISPIIAILSTIIILVYIGPIGLIGVLYILLHAPVEIALSFLFGHFRYLQSLTGDKRILFMDQIISGIRVIKFYVWENTFISKISRIRKREVRYASLSGIIQSTTFSFFNTSIFIALFLLYTVSIVVENPLTPSNIGLAFLVLNTLRVDTVLVIGHAIFSGRESGVALKRIQQFLEFPENFQNNSLNCPENSNSIHIHNFSASWRGTEQLDELLVLKSINLTLDSPKLVAITGPVSAGKSSLLSCLIKELPGLSGHLSTASHPSYAAQEPWIFSGTLRDNIIFGNPLNLERYEKVIDTCCLREDIQLFPQGDFTLIGERGVTLSGGQKTRVSLARSVYKQADIYLFDDPLSSVDFRVGKDLFNNCMRGFLSSKLILLVTHHIYYVRQVDYIIVMREGVIEGRGVYPDIIENNTFCKEYLQGLEKERNYELSKASNTDRLTDMISTYSFEELNESYESIHPLIPIDTETTASTQPLSTYILTENSQKQSNSIATYLKYFRASGVIATLVLLALTILSNGCLLLAYWWMQSIAKCSQLSDNSILSNMTSDTCSWYFDFRNYSSLLLLSLFTIAGSVFMFLQGFNFYYLVLQAGRRLHNKMLNSVMHTNVYFFDTNPSGRILNRFSKDIGFMDEQLPIIFYDFWQSCTYNIAIAIACCAIQVLLIVPFLLLCFTTLSLRYFYLKTSTQVKHLESICRSPLYSHISLTLQGLSTIRALGMEKKLIQDFYHFQDEHTGAWYNYTSCQKWFGLRLDILTSFLAIFGILSAFVARCILNWEELLDFSIPLLLTLPSTFQYVVRLSGEVDILMVSVDRVLEYCNLYQEDRAAPHFPAQSSPVSIGCIEFKNIFFKYANHLPYTLRDISLVVHPGEKIGIIGRTGAGKSSLLNSLLLTNSLSSGSIIIDNVDISSLDISVHRKRLSIIPQDPFLFSGTLRQNLDPLDEFTSEEIWEALDKSYLKSRIDTLSDKLMSPVQEHGHNFSTGVRQLLCLARAVLRRNEIILIDEATANVDLHTDWLVQQAIRGHFYDCTVLTIAHRIDTIINSDRIVVMDKGRVVETDIPYMMLQDETSYLSRLLGQMDICTQCNLRSLALHNYNRIINSSIHKSIN